MHPGTLLKASTTPSLGNCSANQLILRHDRSSLPIRLVQEISKGGLEVYKADRKRV